MRGQDCPQGASLGSPSRFGEARYRTRQQCRSGNRSERRPPPRPRLPPSRRLPDPRPARGAPSRSAKARSGVDLKAGRTAKKSPSSLPPTSPPCCFSACVPARGSPSVANRPAVRPARLRFYRDADTDWLAQATPRTARRSHSRKGGRAADLGPITPLGRFVATSGSEP
jgi:hypothetical protein